MTSLLSGSNREKGRDALRTTYASKLRIEEMFKTDLEMKKFGNLKHYKGSSVLDQVRKEALAMQDEDMDDMMDLKKKIDKESISKHATLHNLMVRPFCIYALSITQLNVLKKLKAEKIILTGHIDSTGKVVRTPKGVNGDVLYTIGATNIKNIDGKTALNFPFLEMLSTENTAFRIRSLLEFFKNECEKNSLSNWPLFNHMISDFSRPMLYAICEAWNNMKLIDYINLIYDCFKSNNFQPMNSLTKIHLCYSHLMKNFSRTIKKHYNQKNDSDVVVMRIFCIMRFLCTINYAMKQIKILQTLFS